MTSPKKEKMMPKPTKKRDSHSIHWNAMGAGLLTASVIYPEQQMLLLSMGSSSFVMGILEKLGRKKQLPATP
ncbi:MAG: hypothetical protein HN870_09600 [Gammaproteobacteria bacterium]|jgi:hypothetical protein|nr:hypothetical protein [Gammaproteobacteria bacterium]MBT4608119.1 hypothetical protein [Thiotrichales bacterium]MBT3967707.1 hypothetical protein [Gammaproteobacteria bacterium]MBT4079613.1 hypothetical protein [Gammaproteobacteria bacterium]MBT4329167.1 hypothetical protein [Gammaproteobacteria bacterium]